jgi:hypothetical protein
MMADGKHSILKEFSGGAEIVDEAEYSETPRAENISAEKMKLVVHLCLVETIKHRSQLIQARPGLMIHQL